MRVKVDGRHYDGDDVPIMVVFSEEDIAALVRVLVDLPRGKEIRFAVYPNAMDGPEIDRFMENEK